MLAVWTTSDRITFWTAIATICVFLVYAYIAWETRKMAKASNKSAEESRKSADAAIKSAEVSAKAFGEGQKYQELAAKHQELSSSIDLLNLLMSQYLSEEARELQFKMADVEGSVRNNLVADPENYILVNIRTIISYFQYLESISNTIRTCYPLLSENAQWAVVGMYYAQADLFYPFYKDYEDTLFGEVGKVAYSNLAWLYDKAEKLRAPHPGG